MTEVKPTHAAIRRYHRELAEYADHGAVHETAVRAAFFNLLERTCPSGWKWIPETAEKVAGRTVRPDATLEDQNYLPRGYWEAKDTSVNLDAEVAKKIKRGYSLENTIFEDTREAILYQNGREVERYDLTSAAAVADLLNDFYGYAHPIIVDFEKAVAAFKDDVARLAAGFKKKIDEAHRDNPPFQKAFESFLALCRRSVNPNISRDAVDEMLIQHMFTERLLRTVFDQEDFVRRNVVAAEVEKVVAALVSRAFDRKEFMGRLDRFYVAVEEAAKTITDWPAKRNFITGVYEKFFQGYAVKVADTLGIVYTPAPLVDFMCASVNRVLQDEFGAELGDEEVVVIDPAAGTGSFVARLLEMVSKRRLGSFYRERLFANEVMLLPYYVAALNVEHTYRELAGRYEPFDGLCFVDTLGLMDEPQQQLAYMTEANAERVERQLAAPITVVLGNPPYNVGQLNENDNNKNRRYPAVEKRIRETYAKDSTATNKNALADAYVKFFRWATDRLGGRDGVVCLVSNNGFLDGVAFDGFRKNLQETFAKIYHFDFKGNARTSGERRRREGGNIFLDQIRVGVGVTVLVKKGGRCKTADIYYHVVGDYWKEPEKTAHVKSFADIKEVEWQRLKPDARFTWLVPPGQAVFEGFTPLGTKEAKRKTTKPDGVIFELYGRGVATCRDDVVYDYDARALRERVKEFITEYNTWVYRFRDADGKPTKRRELQRFVDNFVSYDKVKWSESLKANLVRGLTGKFDDVKVRSSLYRPFNKRWLYFDALLNERRYQFPAILPDAEAEAENRVICISGLGSNKPFHCISTDIIPCLDLIEKTQCFPFYIYDEDGSSRRENVTDWALAAFRNHYKDEKITKWDIFYYCYGVLHHPKYRKGFAGCLKRELARVPFAPEFWPFAQAGRELADLHVGYEAVERLKLEWRETPGEPLSWRVEKMKWLDEEKATLRVNETLTLAGIPKEAHEYKLGNRSALDWLVDQYVVKRDPETHAVTSDPNRADDPEYIVRLIGQVAHVGVETVRIVKGLPKKAW
jgi:predicted helicase